MYQNIICRHPPCSSAPSSILACCLNEQWVVFLNLTFECIMMLPNISQALVSHIPPKRTPPFLPPPHTGQAQCRVAASPAERWCFLSVSGWHAACKLLLHCFQDSFFTLASSTIARWQRTQTMSLQTLERVIPFLCIFSPNDGKMTAWARSGCEMRAPVICSKSLFWVCGFQF